MSAKYYEEHDICFWKKAFDGSEYAIENPKFAWSDWGLIPTSRPYISTPKANYTLTQIPNSSSRLNITDFMPGGMTFESRTGEWQFAIDHTKELWKNWYDGYYKIEEYFHGSRMLVSLNDDAKNIYEGRITVSAYDPGDYFSTVTLQYDLDATEIQDLKGIRFRIRWLNYNNIPIYTHYYLSGEMPISSYFDNRLAYPEGSVAKGWDPSIKRVKSNADYRPKYYYRMRAGYHEDDTDSIIPGSLISKHPIRYVIDGPTEIIEASYEIPDNLKFLF